MNSISSDYISFIHSGAMGDFLASLEPARHLCEGQGKKAILYLDLSGGLWDPNVRKQFTEQATALNPQLKVRFTPANYHFLYPLLSAQSWISEIHSVESEAEVRALVSQNPGTISLNAFRSVVHDCEAANARIAIAASLNHTKPQQVFSTNILFAAQKALGFTPSVPTRPWIDIPSSYSPSSPDLRPSDYLFVRTNRYHASDQMWTRPEFQKAFHKDHSVQFLGTPLEHEAFQDCFSEVYKGIPRAPVKDALEAAWLISHSRVFASNATFFFWLALSLFPASSSTTTHTIYHELHLDIGSTVFSPPRAYPGPGGIRIKYWQGGKETDFNPPKPDFATQMMSSLLSNAKSATASSSAAASNALTGIPASILSDKEEEDEEDDTPKDPEVLQRLFNDLKDGFKS